MKMLNKLNIFKSRDINNFKSFNTSFNFKTFAERVKLRKDYYQILGIAKIASEEEIKTAYRNLAKRYHPDVNVGVETHEPNVEKFRDIAEAYAVLSNKTMRLDYDTRMRNFPDMIYNAEKVKKMKETEMNRDQTAHEVKPAPMKGSYAEYRLGKLKELRKQFNVDDLGNYKGGVPRKHQGQVRGESMGIHGMHHNPWNHNEFVHDNPQARPHVSLKESQDHKLFMNSSRNNFQRFKPYYKMDEIETDANYYVDSEHRKLFWVPIILLFTFGSFYLYERFSNYRKFNHFETKVESLKPYEFLQHGPIILYAPTRKFMEKYQTREEYHQWLDNDMRSFG